MTPDANTLDEIGKRLDLLGLRRVRFIGQISPEGARDWHLTGRLGATVIQPCSTTLDPVTTRIDAAVERLYLADYAEPDGDDVEMPEDERQEPVPDTLDLLDLLEEALALNLPLYPRSDGAVLAQSTFTEPGKTALVDADLKPFAGLAALRDKLQDKS